MNSPSILSTKWGDFKVFPQDENSLIVTGYTNLGGQDYRIVLRLFKHRYGWSRRQYDDLRITKINGPLAGKPARLAARQVVVDYLPELVNSVYPIPCG